MDAILKTLRSNHPTHLLRRIQILVLVCPSRSLSKAVSYYQVVLNPDLRKAHRSPEALVQ
jgi:hypothetical protein